MVISVINTKDNLREWLILFSFFTVFILITVVGFNSVLLQTISYELLKYTVLVVLLCQLLYVIYIMRSKRYSETGRIEIYGNELIVNEGVKKFHFDMRSIFDARLLIKNYTRIEKKTFFIRNESHSGNYLIFKHATRTFAYELLLDNKEKLDDFIDIMKRFTKDQKIEISNNS